VDAVRLSEEWVPACAGTYDSDLGA
jgi:hypothetical protein